MGSFYGLLDESNILKERKNPWSNLIIYVFKVAPQIWNIGRCLQFKLRGVANCAKAFFTSLIRVGLLAPSIILTNPTSAFTILTLVKDKCNAYLLKAQLHKLLGSQLLSSLLFWEKKFITCGLSISTLYWFVGPSSRVENFQIAASHGRPCLSLSMALIRCWPLLRWIPPFRICWTKRCINKEDL